MPSDPLQAAIDAVAGTWHFVVEDALLCCPDCGECLTENYLAHDAKCQQVARMVTAIRRSEREHLAQLASELRATIPADHPPGAQASFADYLRITQETTDAI
ncbi:MAG TPA: hypothetical protein VIX86_11635 [Streptosporangiaceae bacterium]